MLELGVVRPSSLAETRVGERAHVGTRAVWTQINNVRYQISGSQSGVVEDSGVRRRERCVGLVFSDVSTLPSKRLESHIQRYRVTSHKV